MWEVDADLDALGTLVGLSSDMNDFSDEQTVLREVHSKATDVIAHLERDRKYVGELCPRSKVARAKAQSILALYDQVRSEVAAILLKLDTSATYGRPAPQ